VNVMRKYFVFFLLVIIALMIFTVTLPPVEARAEMPAVCAWAGYGPQWMAQCLIQIAMILWMDPLTLL